MFDFLKPKILEEADSKYSGRIKVVKNMGDIYIGTGLLTQSGGIVKDVWNPVLKKYGRKNKSWLILGLAGGTTAKIISDRLSPVRITGIEVDPLMIKLGKKYLNLDKIPGLKIVIADAKDYLLTTNDHYDYILVDMYLGDQLPDFVYSSVFLRKLGKLGKLVIINHLFYDDPKRQKAGKLVTKLKDIFPSVQLMRKLTNLLIICG